MKIYTKTGDEGQTSLFDQTRVSKADVRVDAYGEVDELNACLGAARAAGLDADLGAALETELTPLRRFILPGGSRAGATLHLGRTVCRRAERAMVALGGLEPELLTYINRVSDLLFVMARAVNHRQGHAELEW